MQASLILSTPPHGPGGVESDFPGEHAPAPCRYARDAGAGRRRLRAMQDRCA